jgi:Xaa-Pro aminopeptidase
MRFRLLFVLLLCPGFGYAQEGKPLFTPWFPPEEFAARRVQVMDSIGPNAVALVQGASAPHSSARFRQSNEFFYLCGVETPNAVLWIDGLTRETRLYLPHRNEARAGIDGTALTADNPQQVMEVTGVQAVFGVERLAEHLARQWGREQVKTLYTPFSPAEGPSASRDGELRAISDRSADAWDGRGSREGHLRTLLNARFPHYTVRDLSPLLDAMRLVKSGRELALIRWANRLSGEALMEAMRSTVPGVVEQELDALARFIFVRHGAQGEGYAAIVASGPNAWYPHHRAAGRVLQDGELVLMDYAPDVGYYRTDLTRQWPVNGRFNAWQRELYGFYLACYKAILTHIRPGVTAAQIRQEAVAEMEQLLARATFSKPEYQKAAQAFVFNYRSGSFHPEARLGHWVGMATHDVGTWTGPLRPGMVFTIEPALTVPEELIYIRLEDLIIITETGAEVASDFVPMEIDAIERIMQEPGMLQRYPRATFVDR